MEEKNSEIVIVGGGMIGLFCAYYLADSGRKVRIIERDRVGEGASHANCGLLLFSDFPPLCSPGTVSAEIKRFLKKSSPLSIKPGLNLPLWHFLYRFTRYCNESHFQHASRAKRSIHVLSRDLFQSFFKAHPFAEYKEKGIYVVCKTRKGLEKYGATNQLMEPLGFDATPLSAEELLEREPALNETIAGGFYHHGDSHLRPDGLVRHLRHLVEQKGVKIDQGCRVTGFVSSGRRMTALETSRGRYRADQFVVAAGAWSAELLKHLKVSVPVQPGKGYSISMNRPAPCITAPCMFLEHSVVATPFNDGFRLGGTMEFSGWDESLNRKRLNNILKAAVDYLKEPLDISAVEEWTGFRPMSVDDIPIISRLPGHDNTILATGHGMLGITLATGTGKLVSQMVESGDPDIDIGHFSLDRFSR